MVGYSYASVGESGRPSQSSSSPARATAWIDPSPYEASGRRWSTSEGATPSGAATRNESDLATQSHVVLSLAARAERITHARSGRFTTSVVHLWRVSPALARQTRLVGARLSAQTRRSAGSVRLHVFLGAYNTPGITVHAIAR